MTGSYAYEAVDPRGKRLRGTADAASPSALVRSLEEGGLLVLEVGDAGTDERSVRLGRGWRRAVLEVTRALASLLPGDGAFSALRRADVYVRLRRALGAIYTREGLLAKKRLDKLARG